MFCLWENCISIGCIKLSLLRREDLSMALNMLTNRIKILHIINRDFLQVNCFPIYQKIWYRCCRSAFKSVGIRLPCCFLKANLKRDFLDIDLTTFLEGRNLRNKSAMRVIPFFKMFKVSARFQKWRKKLRKIFFVFAIIGCELVTLNCIY